jgi:hypothetical protein
MLDLLRRCIRPEVMAAVNPAAVLTPSAVNNLGVCAAAGCVVRYRNRITHAVQDSAQACLAQQAALAALG